MEELKENKPQNGEGGGRKRRRKKKHKNGGQNAQQQNVQNVAAQPQKPQQPQQKAVPQPQPQKQKNKNKQPQPQNNKNADNKEENRKDTYAYVLDGNLYINLTNKCSNACDFCVRNERNSYFGHYLWIRHGDPTFDKVVAQVKGLGDLTRFKEVVFCGFFTKAFTV